jgi:hypothetical protein
LYERGAVMDSIPSPVPILTVDITQKTDKKTK